MNNVEIYKQLESELAENLESNYTYNVVMGNLLEAYQILGKLMAYKLIDKYDDRLSPKNTMFKKVGISIKDRFALDLRKDTNYLPGWLFADIPTNFKTILTTQEHVGQRRDFGYVVDIAIPKRDMGIEFRLLNTPMGAQRAVEGLGEVFSAETGKRLKISTLVEEVKVGYTRIYDISLSGNVLGQYKTLGYVLVYKNSKDGKFYTKMILKSKVLEYYFIDIASAYNKIGHTILTGLNLGNAVNVGFLVDYRESAKKQALLVREDRLRLNKIKEMKRNKDKYTEWLDV